MSMNYYILPKNINIMINITPIYDNTSISSYISKSYDFYLSKMVEQIELEIEITQEIKNAINISYYFFNPQRILLKDGYTMTDLELTELFNIIDLNISNKDTLYITESTNLELELGLKLNIQDAFMLDKKVEVLIIDMLSNNTTTYINNMILSLYLILKLMNTNGIAIIKLDKLIYKPILDFLYIISIIFDKNSIVKCVCSNMCDNYKYLVCKGFNLSHVDRLKSQLETVCTAILRSNNICIRTLLNSDNEIPTYFINKIEELNAILGQQQLELFDQIINISKSKNREEKIKSIKISNYQKCIQWCEKNNIPYNKQLVEKPNIFKKTDDEIKN
jgi:hypothetical protein